MRKLGEKKLPIRTLRMLCAEVQLRIFLYILFILFTFILTGHSPKAFSMPIKSLPKLVVKINISDHFFNLTTCSGAITGIKDLLRDIGISDKYFKSNKVGCGRGDFNGDGFEDYFFYKLKKPSSGKVKVIFLKGKSVLEAYVLDHILSTFAWVYDPSEKDVKYAIQNFGCPDSKNKGIVEWGEGDSSHVFIYNKKDKRFVKSDCSTGSH